MKVYTKPQWLNKKINLGVCSAMKERLRSLGVETVCEQAACPNMGECFARGEATFLILGRRCTRMCSFCNIEKRDPEPVDEAEPARVAEAVERFDLKHVVVTSVTRDDLPDGGSGAFAETVRRIRAKSPGTSIELLIPDFRLSREAVKAVVNTAPDIIAHNVETVPSLYETARSGSDYRRSLDIIRVIKELAPAIKTKSGLMLGMGEAEGEVLSVMSDLRAAGCDFLSIGQYLAPTKRHYPVKEYVPPEKFEHYRSEGLSLGFLHIESAPYVRSSYKAAEYLT
jgi:lipoic acid synthetase